MFFFFSSASQKVDTVTEVAHKQKVRYASNGLKANFTSRAGRNLDTSTLKAALPRCSSSESSQSSNPLASDQSQQERPGWPHEGPCDCSCQTFSS